MTLNNPTEAERAACLKCLMMFAVWICGDEVGESGTPHLQMYFESKTQIEFTSVKEMFPRAHVEKAKGNTKQNIEYCSKEGNFKTNASVPLDRRKLLLAKYAEVTWRPWQQDVINIVEGEPDDRTVHWFWEPTGNAGKSFLAKFLVLKYRAIICSGKRDDVFNQVKTWLDDNPDKLGPVLVVLDCPRCAQEYVSYQAIEALKNGLLYSGKYEGGQCMFDPPHVICLANAPPDREQLSEDRWNVVGI